MRTAALLVTVGLLGGCSSDGADAPGPPILVPWDGGTVDAHEALPDADSVSTPELDLCRCLVLACDRPFHDEFGEGHVSSFQACEVHALGLPHTGTPAEEGDSFECRVHWCQLARSNASLCPAAFGEAICL